MKICITAQGPTLDSVFEHHFARAPYFIFHDTRTGRTEGVRNGFVISDSGIGRNAVDLLKMNGIEAVITGEIGDNARALLNGSGILILVFTGTGSAADARDAMMPG